MSLPMFLKISKPEDQSNLFRDTGLEIQALTFNTTVPLIDLRTHNYLSLVDEFRGS